MEALTGSTNRPPDRPAVSPLRLKVIGIALLITLLSVVVHVTSPSTWHQSEEVWEERLEVHESSPIFSARPLTTAAVGLLHREFGLSIRVSFFALQFSLMAAALICFWYWLASVGLRSREATVGMVILGLSHSVFLAHFEPVHTWSDFWVYALIPLSLAWSLRRKPTMAVVTMLLALTARETGLLFVPFMIWALRLGGTPWPRATLAGVTAVALFLAGRMALQSGLAASPDFKLFFNFASSLRTSDTVYSFIVSLGFVWITGLFGLFARDILDRQMTGFLRWGGVWTVAGFTTSTFLFGQVRESRLFVPAMVFMVPLSILWWRSRRHAIKRIIRSIPSWLRWPLALVLILVGTGLAKATFPEFEYRAWRDGSWVWLGMNVVLAAGAIAAEVRDRRDRSQLG